MNIADSYTFEASRALLWSMLRDPDTLAKTLPGCERLDQVNATQFDATMRIQAGPMQGVYNGTIKQSGLVAPDQMTLLLEGNGPQGPIIGNGRITLIPNGEQSILQYQGELTINGRIAIQSPRLVQTTAKSLLRQFMEALERQIEIQTGVYTTSMEPQPKVAPAPRFLRQTMTIDRSEMLAEIKRDQRTSFIVAILFLLTTLFFVGLIALVRGGMNWLTNYFTQRLSDALQVTPSNTIIEG